MSRVSLEEWERNIIFLLRNVMFFFEIVKNKGPKIHYFLLNFTLGPPNCTVGPPNLEPRGGGPGPLGPPGSTSELVSGSVSSQSVQYFEPKKLQFLTVNSSRFRGPRGPYPPLSQIRTLSYAPLGTF